MMNDTERTAFQLAMGRIFRLGSRPEQPGDIEEYNRCRAVIMDLAPGVEPDYSHNYARDRLKGSGT